MQKLQLYICVCQSSAQNTICSFFPDTVQNKNTDHSVDKLYMQPLFHVLPPVQSLSQVCIALCFWLHPTTATLETAGKHDWQLHVAAIGIMTDRENNGQTLHTSNNIITPSPIYM